MNMITVAFINTVSSLPLSFPLGPCQFGTRYGNMVLGITAEPMQDAEARKRALNSEFLDFQRDRDG